MPLTSEQSLLEGERVLMSKLHLRNSYKQVTKPSAMAIGDAFYRPQSILCRALALLGIRETSNACGAISRFLSLAMLLWMVVGLKAVGAQAIVFFPGSTITGTPSTPLPVTLTFSQAGTIGAIKVVTEGIEGAEFSNAGGGTCAANQSYSAGQQCTLEITFTPKYPGERRGAALVENGNGALLACSFVSGKANGSLAVIVPGTIDTIAGNGEWNYRGDGGLATGSPIFLPMGEAVDAAGNLYLSDTNNNRVRRVDATSGVIATVAGNGTPGFSGDGGLATNAMVSSPAGLLLDGAGNIYFADSGNSAVRRVDGVSGIITTVAGTGTVQGYSGDNGAATSAKLTVPEDVALDASLNLLIADTGNNVIRRVAAGTGLISTVAGTGAAAFSGDGGIATSATLDQPWGVATWPDGSFYIADMSNNRIRKVDAGGMISTLAGTGSTGFNGDGLAATSTNLNAPASVVLDPAGNLYIADSGNNRVRQRNTSTGVIETLAGTGSSQFSGDTQPANVANLYGPYSLYLDGPGNLYISDLFHNRIREISSTSVALQYATMRVSKTSPPQFEALEDAGNTALNLASIGLTNAALDGATTTCAVGALAPAALCTLGVEFAPTVVGNPVLGSVVLRTDAGNSPATIGLSGTVLTVEPTTVSVSSSANPGLVNTPITFTANVTSQDTSRTGTVVFDDGSTQLCSVTLNASGSAACNVSAMSLGQHAITANYSGDANNASSTSPTLTETIKQPTSLLLATSSNPATVTGPVTLTVNASAASGTPTGAVVFLDGGVALNSATLNASGTATYSTSSLSVGTHSLSVAYAGDASDAAGSSNTVQQVVQQAGTTTSVTSSSPVVNVESSVTFTAVVSSNGGPMPTGAVAFNDGPTALGTASLNGSSTASLTLSTLTPGVHRISATYMGDTDNAQSVSPATTETVQQLVTNTSLSSDANPANAGSMLHLTASVVDTNPPSTGAVPTGLVTFQEGSNSLGAARLSTTGSATISITTLSVGPHSITAVYNGDTNNASSTSSVLAQQVRQSSTSTVLSSSNANAVAGTPVTLSAMVNTAGGIATGMVTFRDGTAVLAQSPINGTGAASYTSSALSVGVHNLTATYNGDANYVTSTSSQLQQTTVIAATGVTLSLSANTADAGTAVVIVATLTGNGGQPTGTIVIKDGSVVLSSLPVNGTGAFTYQSSSLSLGTHVLSAFYSGDANDSSSASAPNTLVVQQAPSSTMLQSSANPVVVTRPLTLTATVTSRSGGVTGTVTFLDGGVTLGSVPLNSTGIASLTSSALTLGSHTLSAAFSGDANHLSSSSASEAEQVVQSVSASLASNQNPSIAGVPLSLTAKVTGTGSVTPTGLVTFVDGSVVLGSAVIDGSGTASMTTASLSVGQHSITAAYSGDRSYEAVASTPLLQSVTLAQTQVVVLPAANPSTFGSQLQLRATVTGNGGQVSGSVTFEDGSNILGRVNVTSGGIALLTMSSLIPGIHNIQALYSGDASDSPAVSPMLAEQVQQITSVSLASSVNPVLTLAPITFSSRVSNQNGQAPTGEITFTNGPVVLGTAVLDGTGTASLLVPALGAGSNNIVASYSGDSSNYAGVASTLVQSVLLRATTDTLTASATSLSGGQQATLISVLRWNGPVTPGGLVTFTTGGNLIGTAPVDSTGVATITVVLGSAGEDILASYGGDAVYSGSTSSNSLISGGPASQFTMQTNPLSLTLQTRQHASFDLTISSVKQFSDTLSLGCLGLPFAATCTFSTDNVSLQANGTTVVHVVLDTGSPLGAGAQARVRRSGAEANTALFCFLPGGALLALVLRRSSREMLARNLLMVFLMATFALQLSGCSSLQINATPPGTYSIRISAVGKQTGVSQAQSMILTVTP